MTVQNDGNAGLELTWTSHDEDLQAQLTASGLSDREYGTFEVSVIDIDELDTLPGNKHRLKPRGHSWTSCSDDCALLLRILLAPFRLETYKCLLFHVANFIFAVLAGAWYSLLQLAKALAYWNASWLAAVRQLESDSLRLLLEVDCGLFNFISPSNDSVTVYNSSSGFQAEADFLGMYAQVYFMGAKLLCAAVPGFVFAVMFIWSWVHAVVLASQAGLSALDSEATATPPTDVAISETHQLELEFAASVIALYGCVLLLQVVAYVSRYVTMFFCSQYLVYSQ